MRVGIVGSGNIVVTCLNAISQIAEITCEAIVVRESSRAKGEAWFQISRQAGTSYRTALWPGGCGGLGDKISCSPTAENVAGCGAGTAVKSGC